MTPSLRYPGRIRSVTFLERPNRYVARVRAPSGGPSFLAHVPNPGRMEELLIPGVTSAYAVPVLREGRHTSFDLVTVRHGRTLVSIDSRIGNRLVRQALETGALAEFGPGPWRPEVRWGASRIDFATGRAGARPTALVEVKCSNLKVGDTAMFPDAPTCRGTRHVRELARAARLGIRAGVVFVVQRDDADRFRPNSALDPEFARALVTAATAGVRIEARSVHVRSDRLTWGRRLPVDLAVGEPLKRVPPHNA